MLTGLINLLLMFPKVLKVCDLPPKLKVSKQKGYVYAILITEDSVGKVMAKSLPRLKKKLHFDLFNNI